MLKTNRAALLSGFGKVLRWANDDLLQLKREEIGESYGRYRLHVPEAERAMARSLKRYGQLSPVVVCQRQERYELIDGFKRLGGSSPRPSRRQSIHIGQAECSGLDEMRRS